MPARLAKQVCDAREFAQWMVLYGIEPWGEGRADWRSAMVASTVANALRGKKQRAFQVKDFLPKFGPARQQTVQEQKAIMDMIAGHQNRQVK